MMKLVLSLAAVLLIAASVVMAGAPRFTLCGDANDILTNVQISSDTPTWKASTTVKVIVTGNLKTSVESGSIKTLAYYDGMKAEDKTDDLCTYDGSPFTCPLSAGTNTWTFPFAIPSVPWPGTLESNSVFTSNNGQMFCMNVAVDL